MKYIIFPTLDQKYIKIYGDFNNFENKVNLKLLFEFFKLQKKLKYFKKIVYNYNRELTSLDTIQEDINLIINELDMIFDQ